MSVERRRSKSPLSPPASEDEYEYDDELQAEDASRSRSPSLGRTYSEVKRRQVKFKGNVQDEDLYSYEYTEDPDPLDSVSRQPSFNRQESGLSRQGSFFSRNVSFLSRSATMEAFYNRANTLGHTLKRMALGRLDFDNDEEVEEAAQVLHEQRQRLIDEGRDGHGALERVSTMMMTRTETLARNLTIPFEFVRQKTLQKVKETVEYLKSEEVQAKLQRTKTEILRASTGRPSWDPEPRRIPLPSVCNLCSYFILLFALMVPALFFFDSSRQTVMSVTVKSGLLGRFAGPDLPALSLPPLGQVCSSGGMSQKLNPNSPALNSSWWSSALGDGAQIQIQSSGGFWLGPPSTVSGVQGSVLFSSGGSHSSKNSSGHFTAWGQSPLGFYSNSVPDVTTFLTVERVNSSAFHLIGPNGLYLALTDKGEIVAVSSSKTLSSVFYSQHVDNSTVYLQTYDRQFISPSNSDGSGSADVSSSGKAPFEIREVVQVARIRGVNLGGWLVMEEWMTPNIYSNVPDLVDGWQLHLQSATTGMYVSTHQTDFQVFCDNTFPGNWETWHVRRLNDSQMSIQLRNRPRGYYLSAMNGGGSTVYAGGLGASTWETYTLHVSPFDSNRVMFETTTGTMLRANSDGSFDGSGSKPADFSQYSAWGGDTTFILSRLTAVQGEYQVSQWAPGSAALLTNHRNTFIQESSFQYMASLGINTVRVPVGYWIAEGDSPDPPFIGGSLEDLDAAFALAEKYNIRVYISMHGAVGGQNYGDECATRDGILDFGRGDSLTRTLNAISVIAERYAKSKALFGIGVLNEPNVDLTYRFSLDDLKQYQIDAYNAIRTYSPCCYVGISGFLGGNDKDMDGHMVDPLKFNNVIYDLHYYTVFDPNTFGSMGKGDIFNYVQNVWGPQIQYLQQGGRTVMIGEWSLALPDNARAGFGDYVTFSQVQLQTYDKASAGWFFWSLTVGEGSTGFPNWSLKDAFPMGWLHY